MKILFFLSIIIKFDHNKESPNKQTVKNKVNNTSEII